MGSVLCLLSIASVGVVLDLVFGLHCLVFILSIPCTLNHLRVTRGVKEKCISTSNTSLNISELIYITREIATVDPTLLSFLV